MLVYSAGVVDSNGHLLVFGSGCTSKTYKNRSGTGWYAGWRIAEDNDGWIEWNGGECPVQKSTRVEVRYRCGSKGPAGLAGGWRWSNKDCDYDVIAYKVVT